jgi:hypothetical protein
MGMTVRVTTPVELEGIIANERAALKRMTAASSTTSDR